MSRTSKAVCPYCRASLTAPGGLRVGKKIHCPQCASPFTVPAAESAPAVAASAAPPQPVGASMSRLVIVLCGCLLYLGGGTLLTAICLQRDSEASESTHAPSTQPIESAAPREAPPAPPEPPAVSPRARSTVTVSAAEQRKIDDAIVKGVWYLKDQVLPGGTWGNSIPAANIDGVAVGFLSLPGLTLLECGVPADDPIIQKAAENIRREAPRLNKNLDTYQRSLAVLFLDRLGNRQDDELIQYLALCLIAGQRSDDFGWGYTCPSLNRKATKSLLETLRGNQQTLDDWRHKALKGIDFAPERSDNSNSQFAILALWVARRHGVPIDRTIERVEKRFNDTQLPNGPDPTGKNLNQDGAWPYNPESGLGSNVWPTMTCAGLLGLAVAQGVAAEKTGKSGKDSDRAARGQRIRRGLAMLGREIERPGESRPLDLYFLWSLERVGVLFDLKKIEGKDWYAWGRKPLLERQQADGSWKDGHYWGNNPVLDTCFALLFLKQANLAGDLTPKLQLLTGK